MNRATLQEGTDSFQIISNLMKKGINFQYLDIVNINPSTRQQGDDDKDIEQNLHMAQMPPFLPLDNQNHPWLC